MSLLWLTCPITWWLLTIAQTCREWWRGITCFRCWFDGASTRSVACLHAPRHGFLRLDSLSGRDELMMMLPQTCRGLVCTDTMFLLFGCCYTVYAILCILFWMFGTSYAMYEYDVWINACVDVHVLISMPVMLYNNLEYIMLLLDFIYAGK